MSLETLDRAAVVHAVERLRAMGVDGVLVIAPKVAATTAAWDLPSGFPVVAVEAGTLDDIPVVAIDQHEGARLATEHLLALGHTTVHHWPGRPSGRRRSCASRAGGTRSTRRVRAGARPRAGTGARARATRSGASLLELDDLTAVFVANDQMALGLIRLLHEHGVACPRTSASSASTTSPRRSSSSRP